MLLELDKKRIQTFQKKILHWYTNNKRDLPWRKTRDPYKILVSEVMLQQTQVMRVIPKYEEWLKTFPTIESLAKAPVADVLRIWSGLGYNRRALYLKKLAEVITNQYNGHFPLEEKKLLALPGIGKYTARAVLCFAFDKQVAVVDTNVKKVIITQFKISNNEIQQIADQLLPKSKAYEWNQALMDYASTVLKSEKIPIPKQSKFLGSRRYYRGQVLKQLLKKKELKVAELGSLIKPDFSKEEHNWLKELLADLKKEGFVKIGEGTIKLL